MKNIEATFSAVDRRRMSAGVNTILKNPELKDIASQILFFLTCECVSDPKAMELPQRTRIRYEVFSEYMELLRKGDPIEHLDGNYYILDLIPLPYKSNMVTLKEYYTHACKILISKEQEELFRSKNALSYYEWGGTATLLRNIIAKLGLEINLVA